MSGRGRVRRVWNFRPGPSSGPWFSDFGLPVRTLLCGLVLALAVHPTLLPACAACYGQSDSPMAQGMNWGIMSLLVVVGVVLGGVATFFVFLAKRAASAAVAAAKPTPRRASPEFQRFPAQLGLARRLALPDRADPLEESTNPFL